MGFSESSTLETTLFINSILETILQKLLITSNNLASVNSPRDGGINRIPLRPIHLRQSDYDQHFDFNTIFYDCYRTDNDTLLLQGPPPLNFLPHIRKGRINFGKAASELDQVKLPRKKIFNITTKIPADSNGKIELDLEQLGTHTLNIGENHAHFFADRRVLLTMVKFDHLEWIQQWVEFHVKAHGIDSILVYNNNSLCFKSAQLLDTIAQTPGIERACVVEWAFPYGPQGGTDSAFAQVGALAHARRRFLGQAKCAINADIDELIFVDKEGSDICQLVEKSKTGYIRFGSFWASHRNGLAYGLEIPEKNRRYRDCQQIMLTPRKSTKWAIVPSETPNTIEWQVHHVPGMPCCWESSEYASFRHFPDFNTFWKPGGRTTGISNRTTVDTLAIETFERIGWL